MKVHTKMFTDAFDTSPFSPTM